VQTNTQGSLQIFGRLTSQTAGVHAETSRHPR
jgi:hypothetical protein